MNTTTLWQSYVETGDSFTRDRLLTEHLGLVHHVARQLSRSLSTDTDLDELVSAGSIGLMNAVDSYDPERGLAFSTFAAPRIRGAILDELRKQDHVPRSVRRKTREMSSARESLTHTLGRLPGEREVAAEMGIDLPTLWRWQIDSESAVRVSFDRPVTEERGAGPTLMDMLSDEAEGSVEDRLNHEQEVGVLREAILQLKEQERVVLSLYFFEELKLHEIATILELTESRVSQIRTKALGKLRGAMAHLREKAA